MGVKQTRRESDQDDREKHQGEDPPRAFLPEPTPHDRGFPRRKEQDGEGERAVDDRGVEGPVESNCLAGKTRDDRRDQQHRQRQIRPSTHDPPQVVMVLLSSSITLVILRVIDYGNPNTGT